MSRVMSAEKLDRLLSAASDFDLSDLHLVAGVPPAFRVNGEIIIADEDAILEKEITAIADGLLNEQQKKKFELEWEMHNSHSSSNFFFCCSLSRPSAMAVISFSMSASSSAMMISPLTRKAGGTPATRCRSERS